VNHRLPAPGDAVEEEDVAPLPRCQRVDRGALSGRGLVHVRLRSGTRGERVARDDLVLYANRAACCELADHFVGEAELLHQVSDSGTPAQLLDNFVQRTLALRSREE